MTDAGASTRRGSAWPRAVAAVAIVLTAANLRPAVTSAGALLPELRDLTGLTAAGSGLLTSLPPICFGLFGLLGARLGRRYGVAPTLVGAMLLTAAALVARVVIPAPAPLLLGTVAALAGMATGNVLLPVVVKRWFPDRVGAATGWYSVGLALGTAIAAGAAVPLAEAAGSVPIGLAAWAVPALLAAVPWLWLRDRGSAARATPQATTVPLDRAGRRALRRHPKALALLVYFGLQSSGAYALMGWLPTIYRDAGVAPDVAGALLALLMLVGVPVALVLPVLAGRSEDQRRLVWTLAATATTGYLGLLLAPAATPWLPWLWAAVLGVGLGAFPLSLVLIGLRASGAAATAELSSFVQGGGYLLAAAGPFVIGVLSSVSGGWDVPLLVLIGLQIPQLAAGALVARPGTVDP